MIPYFYQVGIDGFVSLFAGNMTVRAQGFGEHRAAVRFFVKILESVCYCASKILLYR